MSHVSVHLEKKLNKVESSYPEIFLFYYTFNQRCCNQVVKIKVECNDIKHFNVEFVDSVPLQSYEIVFWCLFLGM